MKRRCDPFLQDCKFDELRTGRANIEIEHIIENVGVEGDYYISGAACHSSSFSSGACMIIEGTATLAFWATPLADEPDTLIPTPVEVVIRKKTDSVELDSEAATPSGWGNLWFCPRDPSYETSGEEGVRNYIPGERDYLEVEVQLPDTVFETVASTLRPHIGTADKVRKSLYVRLFRPEQDKAGERLRVTYMGISIADRRKLFSRRKRR